MKTVSSSLLFAACLSSGLAFPLQAAADSVEKSAAKPVEPASLKRLRQLCRHWQQSLI